MATSATAWSPAPGAQVLTLSGGVTLAAGAGVWVRSAGTPGAWAYASVDSQAGDDVTLSVLAVGDPGAGPYSDWQVSVAVPREATWAASAGQWADARTITLDGALSGAVSLDGSADATLTTALTASGVTAGTWQSVTVGSDGRVTAGAALTADNIPGLAATKITSGTLDPARLPAPADMGAIAAASGYVLGARLVITASTTYTPPAGLRAVDVVAIGGGGGGGAALTVSGACGSGGYGGGYARALIPATDLASTVAVTVGAGGAGAGGGGGAGSEGGTSSFGSHLSATGGAGGESGTTATNTYNLSASPGMGSGGQINISGGAAGPGLTAIPVGGDGGDAPMGYGSGGPGYTGGNPGLAGRGYGAGGGGAARVGANRSGGAGAPGLVIIEEYY